MIKLRSIPLRAPRATPPRLGPRSRPHPTIITIAAPKALQTVPCTQHAPHANPFLKSTGQTDRHYDAQTSTLFIDRLLKFKMSCIRQF